MKCQTIESKKTVKYISEILTSDPSLPKLSSNPSYDGDSSLLKEISNQTRMLPHTCT